MSLSDAVRQLGGAVFPVHLQVRFAADGVHLRRLDWRACPYGEIEYLAIAATGQLAPQWQPWLAALATWIGRQPPRRLMLQVLLSDRFVRYQHLPWRSGIVHRREREAYAGHRFREVFGEMAAHWQIALSDGVPGNASMACAMDRELLAALRGLGAHVGLTSVQPLFVYAYNRLRRHCRGERFWFAHVESDRVCMALLRSGQSAGIRNETCVGTWPQALAAISRRLGCSDQDDAGTLASDGSAPVPVYVCGDVRGAAAPELLGINPVHILSS